MALPAQLTVHGLYNVPALVAELQDTQDVGDWRPFSDNGKICVDVDWTDTVSHAAPVFQTSDAQTRNGTPLVVPSVDPESRVIERDEVIETIVNAPLVAVRLRNPTTQASDEDRVLPDASLSV
jgi:hypothetical protein